MYKLHRLFHDHLYSKELIFARFFLSIGISGFGLLWGLYLRSLGATDSTIGYIQTFVLIVGICVSFAVPSILKRFHISVVLFVSIVATGLLIMVMSFTTVVFILALILAVSTFFSSFRDNSFGILYRDITGKKAYTFYQGLLYVVINISWIIGPLLFSFFVTKLGFRSSLFIAASTYLFAASLIKLFKIPDKQKIKGLHHIESEIRGFAQKAQNNKLSIDDLTGGTFTISNGGVYGSLMSTPILNPPQSAILGMHSIQERPMVIDGEIKVRPMMYLALSYDHRVIDGKESVSFLVKIKERLEDPRRLILGI